MDWSKESDWLPLSNAIAQVNFWKEDLRQAEEFLDYVETFAQYGVKGYDEILKKAKDDVMISMKGLEQAKQKLRQTKQRIFNKTATIHDPQSTTATTDWLTSSTSANFNY